MIVWLLFAAATVVFTLSLHDALPISCTCGCASPTCPRSMTPSRSATCPRRSSPPSRSTRSEEHTSELQSRGHLVCRLLLAKKHQIHQQQSNSDCYAQHIPTQMASQCL